MDFKHTPLTPLLDALEKLNVSLGIARNAYLALEAERSHFRAKLILSQSGKSVAEKRLQAEATEAWLEFDKKLARAESEFEFLKLKFSILEKDYQAVYQSLKLDAQIIAKG